VPNRVLKHYAQLGISAAEMMWVIHVWEFWWYEQDPYPSLQLLAERMHVSRRQVRNYVASLREKGFLQVREPYSPHPCQTTSEYDFQPLLDAVRAFVREQEAPPLPPRKNRSEGGRKNLSAAPRNPASPEEDEHETDTDRSISNTRRRPISDRSLEMAPATNP